MANCNCNVTIHNDPEAMRSHIRRNYMDALATDPEAVEAGIRWYSDAEAMIAAEARRTGLPLSTVAAVFAVCSINQQWGGNVTIARKWIDYATGASSDRPGCLPIVAERAAEALDRKPETFEDAFEVALGKGDARGSKVGSFVANFHGREDYVTIDRWAMVGAGVASLVPNSNPRKVNTPMPCPTHGKAPKGVKYDRIAQAYRDVAAELGIAPRDLQAAVWVAVRGRAN